MRTQLVPRLTVVALLARRRPRHLAVGREHHGHLSGALRIDDLALALTMIFVAGAIAAVLLAWRGLAPREAGHGEFHALLLAAVSGMVILVAAQNLVAVFIGYELLSIPLYVLCATELRRERSLESGLKYLIIGSVGSATLLYGLAFLYGATGSTDFARDRRRAADERDLGVRRAVPHRHRPDRHRPRLQGVRRAVPPVDARRLPGRPDARHGVHGRRHEGGGVRRLPAALRRRPGRDRDDLGARARRRSRR